jgi:hypothetical protein
MDLVVLNIFALYNSGNITEWYVNTLVADLLGGNGIEPRPDTRNDQALIYAWMKPSEGGV